MSSKHFPRRGDKVNDRRRIPFANGFVRNVIYDDGPDTVIVRFDNGLEMYDYEDFKNTWTDSYGGAFILAGETSLTSEQNECLAKLLVQWNQPLKTK